MSGFGVRTFHFHLSAVRGNEYGCVANRACAILQKSDYEYTDGAPIAEQMTVSPSRESSVPHRANRPEPQSLGRVEGACNSASASSYAMLLLSWSSTGACVRPRVFAAPNAPWP